MRSNADRLLDFVEWEPVPAPENPDGLPYLTHRGVLNLPGIELQCGVLSTGERIFYGPVIDAMVEGLRELDAGRSAGGDSE